MISDKAAYVVYIMGGVLFIWLVYMFLYHVPRYLRDQAEFANNCMIDEFVVIRNLKDKHVPDEILLMFVRQVGPLREGTYKLAKERGLGQWIVYIEVIDGVLVAYKGKVTNDNDSTKIWAEYWSGHKSRVFREIEDIDLC